MKHSKILNLWRKVSLAIASLVLAVSVLPAHAGDTADYNAFYPDSGTWVNPLARLIYGLPAVTKDGEHFTSLKYDFVIIYGLIVILLAVVGVVVGKQLQLRPTGKATSLANVAEAIVEGFHDFLVGVMGEDLANRYSPFIATYFILILTCNWVGIIPGMRAPTANLNVTVGLALVSFFAVHYIAIREAGVKSWFMHFVGDPWQMFPLMFPLHILGELMKPLSLALRLFCNLFSDEMLVAQITGLALLVLVALHLPGWIPFQLPFVMLGLFFGLVQAFIFALLVAVYIAMLSTRHDDHDEHNVRGHVEHTQVHGVSEIIAHPAETSVA